MYLVQVLSEAVVKAQEDIKMPAKKNTTTFPTTSDASAFSASSHSATSKSLILQLQ